MEVPPLEEVPDSTILPDYLVFNVYLVYFVLIGFSTECSQSPFIDYISLIHGIIISKPIN